MMKFTLLKTALLTAASLAFMPNATAYEASEQTGIPYEIVFNGDVYPAQLETMEYPYIAASQKRGGECLLNVSADPSGSVLDISIISCSDDLFKSVAARYINKQSFNRRATSEVTAHRLKIRWKIGQALEAQPLQIATR